MNAEQFRFAMLGNVGVYLPLTWFSATFVSWYFTVFIVLMGVACVVLTCVTRARRVKAIERGEYWEPEKKDAA